LNQANTLRNIPLLIFTVVVDYVGMAVGYTVIPYLFFDSRQATLVSQFSMHERAILLGLVFSLTPLGRLIGGPIFGKLSDRFGRRNLLLISTSMTMVSTLMTGLSISYYSLSLLLVARLIAGFFAGNVPVSQASLVDISAQHSKTWRLNLLEMGMAAGLMLGPMLGARLMSSAEVSWFNYSTPFYFAMLANIFLIVLLAAYFVETLPQSVLRTHQMQRAVGQVKKGLHVPIFLGIKQVLQAFKSSRLRPLFLVWGLSMAGYTLYIEFFSGFLKQQLFFSPIQISNLSVVVAICYIIYQACLVYPLARRVEPSKLIKPSLVILGILIFCMGFARHESTLYLFRLAYEAAMVVFIPNFNAVISNAAGQKNQGQAFGTMTAVYSLGSLLVGLVGGPLMAYAVAAPVVVGGALIMLSSGILVAKYRARG
jgi:MFS transporter, DHA1 family, tetracycline resistance protein